MAAKAILVLCAQALLAQSAFSQCLGRIAAPCGYDAAPWGYDAAPWGYDAAFAAAPYGYGPACGAVAPLVGVAPASGGGFPITSSSPISPSGIAIASENAIEGILAVGGDLPFVSAVALEGALPTAGAGSILYGCGDGSVGIVDAGAAPVLGLADGLAYGAAPFRGLAAPALGLGAPAIGLAAPAYRGCGCGAIY